VSTAPAQASSGGPTSTAAAEALARGAGLTEDELQLLRLLVAGKSRKEIASLTSSSEWTSSVRLHRAKKKLGARTTYQAVAMVAVMDAKR
jgi:DNA-binding CsgD family transcriptional regulator